MREVIDIQEGDAFIIIRKNGDVQFGIDGGKPEDEPTLLAIGITMCLREKGWQKRIIDRVKEAFKDGDGK